MNNSQSENENFEIFPDDYDASLSYVDTSDIDFEFPNFVCTLSIKLESRSLPTAWSVSNCDECSSSDVNICVDCKLGYKLKNDKWDKLKSVDSLGDTTTAICVLAIIWTLLHNTITIRSVNPVWTMITQFQTFLAVTLINMFKCMRFIWLIIFI